MARRGGINESIRTTNALTAPEAYTYHFHYRNTSAPGSTANRPFEMKSGSGSYYAFFLYGHTNAALRQSCFQ
jgi:hypothetical protein